MPVLVLLLAAACAPAATLHLPVAPQSRASLARIVIEDARSEEDRKTYVTTGDGGCFVSHGDDFIEPSKVEYLRSLLAERLDRSTKLSLRLARFDTVERCAPGRDRGLRAGARLARDGNHSVVHGSPDNGIGSDVTLHLAGEANGVPFRFRKGFDHADLQHVEVPSHSAEYRARLQRLFSEFVDELIRAGAAPAVRSVR